MSALLEESRTPVAARGHDWPATLSLILATAFWGAGFTWGKSAQTTINLAGPGEHSHVGPLLFLAIRFLAAGVVWMLLFWHQAGRGWTPASLGRSVVLGVLLAGGIILQHLALVWSSEAVVAFLTTLTIVFVPLIAVIVFRRSPALATWVGIAIALLGVWRMTVGGPRGFGAGGWLGIGCAAVFSVHLLLLSSIVPRDSPWRLTGGQFIIVGICCLAALTAAADGPATLRAAELSRLLGQPGVLREIGLMVIFPTIGAFALMVFFQPRLDPTRAALIYLLEPIWAGAFAWVTAGRAMSREELQGAAIILAANAMVELFAKSRRADSARRVALATQ